MYNSDECHSCGFAIAQVVSCQAVVMEAWFLSQPVHMGVVMEKVALGEVFSKNLRFSLL
jgi:hypothetical protein